MLGIRHYRQMNHGRWRVYRCVDVLPELDDFDDTADFGKSLMSLYGAETVRPAKAPIAGQERFFGLETLGVDMGKRHAPDVAGRL
jgi:ribosomal protein S12 methylthiotransferase accessory factor